MARFKPSLRRAFCGAVSGLEADCLACGSVSFLVVGFAGGGMGFDCARAELRLLINDNQRFKL